MPDPNDFLSRLNANAPIALLPVRLETRFVGASLLVRIYPDDVHMDTHESPLAADEAEWRKRYYAAAPADQQGVWARIVELYGVQRAAWIAATATDDGQRKGAAWTRAPRATTLPDYWIVLGYQDGGRTLTQLSQPVRDVVSTGPNPAPDAPMTKVDPTRMPMADDDMLWMIDWNSAVAAGLGMEIRLTGDQQARGFERLMVVGVKSQLPEAIPTELGKKSAARLEALLNAHHYTGGLALVPQGTPTNSLDNQAAGYSSEDPEHKASYAIERGAPLTVIPGDGTTPSDGVLVADALGVPRILFEHVKGADGSEQLAAQHMNTALWPASWGYFLSQMMSGTLTEAEMAAARKFFIEHVRARGPVPAIRVGNQPYGLLPVTSLERWRPTTTRPDIIIFNLDNPVGENKGTYSIGYNLDANGNATGGWRHANPVEGWFGADNQGAGAAIGDISGNGRPDMAVFHLDHIAGKRSSWRLTAGSTLRARDIAVTKEPDGTMHTFAIGWLGDVWHNRQEKASGNWTGWRQYANLGLNNKSISAARDMAQKFWSFVVRVDGTLWEQHERPAGLPNYGNGAWPRVLVEGTFGIASTPSGKGYWITTNLGAVTARGDARLYPPDPNMHWTGATMGIVATPTGMGYYLYTSSGYVIPCGNAPQLGHLGGQTLRSPISAMALHPNGSRYYLASFSGKVSAFPAGAPHYGDASYMKLAKPVSGIAMTRTGNGYWLVTNEGQVLNFGDAPHLGDMKGQHLNKPVVGIYAAPTGGYWLCAADGGVFTFGNGTPFLGSLGGDPIPQAIMAMAPTPAGDGYWMVDWSGRVYALPKSTSDWQRFGEPPGGTALVRVGTNRDGRLEVFVYNRTGEVYQRWQGLDGTWSGWQRMGAGVVSSMDVARTWDGRLIVIGVGMDGYLWQTAQVVAGGGWNAWSRVPGGPQFRNIAVSNQPDGLLELFGTATDGFVYRRWEATPAGAWSPWQKWGTLFDRAKRIAAIRNGVGEQQLFMIGLNDRIYDRVLPPPPRNIGYYRIGFNLDTKGIPAGGWSDVREIPGWFGDATAGSGIALADISGTSRPDLVLFHIADAEGENQGWYRIGWDLDKKGFIKRWSAPQQVPGWFGNDNQGGGVAVAHLGGNGRPDLVIFHMDNPAGANYGYYRIGWDLDTNGRPARWSEVKQIPGWWGTDTAATAITVADLNGDGRPELIVYFVDNPAGNNTGYVRIGWSLDANGNVASWSTFPMPGKLGPEHAGAGVAVGSFTMGSLAEFLKDARYTWLDSADSVPKAGRSGSPEQDVAGILGMAPTSREYAARSVLGSDYVDYLAKFMRMPVGELWWQKQGNMARRAVEDMGVGLSQRHARSVFNREFFVLGAPRVQAKIDSPTAGLQLNYINDVLLGKGYSDIAGTATLSADPKGTPLLYLLLRHGLLLEYLWAAHRIQRQQNQLDGKAAEGPWLEPELVDVSVDPAWQTNTVWRRLSASAPRLSGTQNIGQVLDSIKRSILTSDSPGNLPAPFYAELKPFIEMCQSLKYLAGRPAATLDLLTGETLDLATNRIDAWITAVASERLKAKRQTAADQTFIGAYGWVEDLTPARSTASDGFIQAPSYAQAAAAAILRSGYLSHTARDGENPFAVDLSSARVRLALSLLDGIRQGQRLGALLGYRFERGLHERTDLILDEFIYSFRRLAPMPAAAPLPGTDAREEAAAAAVADGLELNRRWKLGRQSGAWNATTIPWGDAAARLPRIGISEHTALMAELELLDDALDAVNDAILAEAVYQLVQGNPSRAGAALDLIGKWDSAPAELEVLKTQRSGLAHTHRVMMLFTGNAVTPAAWTAVTPRALAEPFLNAWAAQFFGDPQQITLQAEYLQSESGQPYLPAETRTVRIADLHVAPLDLLYMAHGNAQVQQSELEERVLEYLTRAEVRGTVPAAGRIRFSFGRSPAWPDQYVSFGQMLEAADAARKLLTSSRPLDARDLAAASSAGESGVNGEQVRTRASQAMNDLRVVRGAMEATTTKSLRAALLAAANYGIAGAVPAGVTGDDESDLPVLRAQAEAVAVEIDHRLAALAALPDIIATADGTAAQQVARLQAIFGSDFRVLPLFTPVQPADLQQAFTASSRLLGGKPMEALTWLQRMARVRDGAARLDLVIAYAEAFSNDAHPELTVGQLPCLTTESWVGNTLTATGSRLSLVALVQGALALSVSPTPSLAGLLVDEWVEVVPAAEETTAAAFHYDEPDARAPQAVLLAVTPEGAGTTWNLETLEAILLETMDLAKIRMVDADALSAVGHFLPALYFAVNMAGEAVSTNFTRVAGAPEGRA